MTKLLNFRGLLAIVLIHTLTHVSFIEAYSQVIQYGSETRDSPKIFKALNMDLIYPKIFNSTENVVSSTPAYTPESSSAAPTTESNAAAVEKEFIFVTPSVLQEPHVEAESESQPPVETDDSRPVQEFTSTGRAVDSRPTPYNFNHLIKPLVRQQSAPPYPLTYGQPLRTGLPKRKIQTASDRFTPGEAVASSMFANSNHKHNHNPGKKPSATNIVSSYVPPSDLYSFPPNINAKYPAPSQDPKASLPSGTVSSYIASPSGPLTNAAGYPLPSATNSQAYQYPGPVNHDYLPPPSASSDSASPADDNGDAMGDDDGGGADDSIGVLPASAMDGPDDMKSMPMPDTAGDDHDHDHPPHDHDHDHPPHDHDHSLTGYDDGKEYPTPPPGWLDDHHSDHDSSFSFDDHHGYPHIIYDDHHDDHYHHHHPEPPPTTTEAPPPEPPPEPRVKKYSYFYIGRKLWYIPLYFTVWFSFYVLWLIVKSIARHKVNLPNHYVSRRSLSDAMDSFDPASKEYINQLTVKVLQLIDEYKEKLP